MSGDALNAPEPPRRLRRGERISEVFIAFVVAVCAAALAAGLDWNRPFSLVASVAVFACYLVAARIQFPIVGGWTDPTQLIFVVMLFLVPAPLVPLFVIVAFLVAYLPDFIRGRIHFERSILVFGDSFYALGPSVVFSLFDVDQPVQSQWWVYSLAFGAQVLLVAVGSITRHWIDTGRPPKVASFVQGGAWAYSVDLLLSLVGLIVAIAVIASGIETLVLILPLFGLFWLFAKDRRARMDGALELSRAYRGTAMLLGDVIEFDHAYTGEHSQNVVELSVAVAARLGLSQEQCRSVELAALLHDVGKIAVPKEIIDKPGPLDPDEWTVMKRHTIDGQRMLERVGGALARVGDLVRASHEHYDGSGYPDGLAGRQIPIEARIVTCCDAYSAMTTDRSYRRAMTYAEAAVELLECAGSHFDPDVVDALITILSEKGPQETGSTGRTPSTPSRATCDAQQEHNR
jgi:putative nucleotidyltransferase with HDIG domain